MTMRNALAASLLVLAAAAPAFAQDYTAYIESSNTRYETRPSTATQLFVRPDGQRDLGAWFSFDFPVAYYGSAYETVWVGAHGFVQFGAAVGSTSSSNTTFPVSSANDGVCAPCWDLVSGYAWAWTAGTAPNRRAIVSWDDVAIGYPANPKKVSFQVQFHESNGYIFFAYKPSATGDGWNSGEGYSVGIDSPGDSRFVAPFGNGSDFRGHLSSDVRFEPATVRVTGRVTWDRLVPGTGGIGASAEDSVPAAGLRVEIRRGTSSAAIGWTDADGNYSLGVFGGASGASGKVVLVADNPACVVRAAASGAAHTVDVSSSFSLDAGQTFGTTRIGVASDPGGTARAPIAIAQTIRAVRSWCTGAATVTLPRLDVVWATSSTAATGYTAAAGNSAASLRIASSGSGDEDAWDRAVVTRGYARHVLANIAVLPADAADGRWDAATTPANAFAEGFGWALHSAVFGGGTVVDGTDATQGRTFDLETPGATAGKSASVTAWVAATLHDVVDAANETADRIDGTATGAAARLLTVVDAATTAPDAAKFRSLWKAAGHDPVPLVRLYVAHGFISDDSDEPNDDALEAVALGDAGVVRAARYLNQDNEDWYTVVAPANNEGLFADVVYDRVKSDGQLRLEIRTQAGQVLGSASTSTSLGPIRCAAAPVAPGTYLIRVAHVSGGPIDSYALQSHARLRFVNAPLPEWTVDVPFRVTLGVEGGIPPVMVATLDGAPMPPGLGLQGSQHVVNGAPTQAGIFSVTFVAQDAGDPFNVATFTRSLVVNPPVVTGLGEFTAFALGRAPLHGVVGRGGTAPVATRVIGGRLPAGIGLAAGRLAFDGAASAEESVPFGIESYDAVGSQATTETLGVVCADASSGRARSTMSAGAAACGVFFDGVAGSTVRIGFATAKKMPRRTLRGAVLSTDGTTPLTGGKQKAATGKFSASGIVLPRSGRYFAVVASEGGEATAFDATVQVAPPKAGKGATEELEPESLVEVEVGALTGAKLTLQASVAKGSGARVRVRNLVDPDGVPVLPGTAVTETKQGGLKLVFDLPAAGTWKVILEVRDAASAVKYAYKVAQPKKVAYSAD
jgi:hypothetical protein